MQWLESLNMVIVKLIDFIHKLSIAFKEANESKYWLELLYKSNYIDQKGFNPISLHFKELLQILIYIIKNSKNSC